MFTDDYHRYIADAQDALDRGEHERCLQLTDAVPVGPTSTYAATLLLRGRALLARDPIRAIATLKEGIALISDAPEAHIEARCLLGRAYTFTDQPEAAEHTLRQALADATARSSCRLAAYAAFNLATLFCITHFLNDAEIYAQQAALDQDPLAQARAKAVTSWIRAEHGDNAGQLALARQALRDVQSSKRKDAALEASLIEVLAAVGTNLCDEESVATAWLATNALRWPRELRASEFQTYRALATAAALVGDWFNMERRLRHAITLAPSPAWEAFAHLELARLLRASDNRSWIVELAIAEDLAADVDWQSVRGEQQEAVLLFIELYASVDSGKAATYTGIYHTAARLESRNGARSSGRHDAKAAFAQGMLFKTDGETYLAGKMLRRAWETFDRIGYVWRACESALEALDICAPGESYEWLSRANRILTVAPKSWLSQRLAKRSERPQHRDVHLNPGPARVRELLAAGKTPNEVCAALKLSRNTINKHVAVIKRSYGVATLPQLLAALALQRTAS
ncbi:MAG: hypothetical protein EPN48_18430 [Microbacteriaceae bacterium]|nr:MAG: hypothetical protein EPN48_18430 [Microbacteriaceae bacterium]